MPVKRAPRTQRPEEKASVVKNAGRATAKTGSAGAVAAFAMTFAPDSWGPEQIAYGVAALSALLAAVGSIFAGVSPALQARLNKLIAGSLVLLVIPLAGCSTWVRASSDGFEMAASFADGYSMTCYERDSEGSCLETSIETRGGTLSENGAGAVATLAETIGGLVRGLLPHALVNSEPPE